MFFLLIINDGRQASVLRHIVEVLLFGNTHKLNETLDKYTHVTHIWVNDQKQKITTNLCSTHTNWDS